MAQARRKRHTKHRGNAAGMVEVRGRTGRKPTTAEKGTKQTPDERRQSRLSTPPTWKGSFQRALLATVVFDLLGLLFLKLSPVAVIPLTLFVVGIYTAFGYAFDTTLYRRRMRKQGQAVGGRPPARGAKR